MSVGLLGMLGSVDDEDLLGCAVGTDTVIIQIESLELQGLRCTGQSGAGIGRPRWCGVHHAIECGGCRDRSRHAVIWTQPCVDPLREPDRVLHRMLAECPNHGRCCGIVHVGFQGFAREMATVKQSQPKRLSDEVIHQLERLAARSPVLVCFMEIDVESCRQSRGVLSGLIRADMRRHRHRWHVQALRRTISW